MPDNKGVLTVHGLNYPRKCLAMGGEKMYEQVICQSVLGHMTWAKN